MLDYSKRKCYGFEKNSEEFIINKEEATNVNLIFECFLSGMSLTEIAKELEVREIKSPSGKDTWSRKVLSGTLSNEKYYLYGVVAKDVFDKCQNEKSARTSSPIVVTEEEISAEESAPSTNNNTTVGKVPTPSTENATGEEFDKNVSVPTRDRYARKFTSAYEFSKAILVKLVRKWYGKSPHCDDFYIFKNRGKPKSHETCLRFGDVRKFVF